ncbi:voltage-dependent anion channel-domain-containing protein [Xylaria bambusicola]|uniref:voltage-dependent anion channel-domain-containing protein n=1 Tax=Xylaria bambusicola TaxID=326684 RepID=UPI00200728BA|nr:voltage-dependent anion channel-domain-containing protein [Xylaria bambusicola]KAI0522078.1 voltage-dependent anion channel-domain-containing protein [Xylaria bambusicola]
MSALSESTQLSPNTRGSVYQTEQGTIYYGSRRNEHQSKQAPNDDDKGRQKISRSKSAGNRPVTVSYSTFGGQQNEYMPLLSTQELDQRQWIIEPAESGFLRLVQNFDFKWYGSTMGTGIVSILLFTFSNIYTPASAILFRLSVIFYAFNILLFSAIFVMTALRYFLYPRLFIMMVSDPGQAMYLGTFPMGFATIISMTVNVMVPQFGDSWAQAAWVFWWIDVAVSMATALGVPWLLQVRHHEVTDLGKMTAGWLLPIVAPIVAAATGSVVASVLDPDRALVTILTSYVILGTGLPAALSIIVIYFIRVATKKLPPTEHMVSTFLPLGPLGQGGFAAQKLGEQALRIFPLTSTLPAINEQGRLHAGEVLYTMGFLTAVTLWGFGLMWLFFALLSVTRQKVPFSQGWWAFTFPLGVFAMSTLTMGLNLPSPMFQALGTLFGSVVMVMWLVVVRIMASRLLGGQAHTIFFAPEVTGAYNKRPDRPLLDRCEDI